MRSFLAFGLLISLRRSRLTLPKRLSPKNSTCRRWLDLPSHREPSYRLTVSLAALTESSASSFESIGLRPSHAATSMACIMIKFSGGLRRTSPTDVRTSTLLCFGAIITRLPLAISDDAVCLSSPASRSTQERTTRWDSNFCVAEQNS